MQASVEVTLISPSPSSPHRNTEMSLLRPEGECFIGLIIKEATFQQKSTEAAHFSLQRHERVVSTKVGLSLPNIMDSFEGLTCSLVTLLRVCPSSMVQIWLQHFKKLLFSQAERIFSQKKRQDKRKTPKCFFKKRS